MAERGRSVFDKPKESSMVADILGITGSALKGAASNIAGIGDLAALSPQVAYKIAKGQDLRQAMDSSSGLFTNALGLQAPADGTAENLAYRTGQILMPIGKPVSKGAYGVEVGTNAAVDALSAYTPEDSALRMTALAGLMGGSTAVNRLRNKMIETKGFTPEAAAAAREQGLTLGQSTANPEALRNEAMLASSPKTADDVSKFFKNQSDMFKSAVDKATSKITGQTTTSQTDAVRNAFKDIQATFKARQDSIGAQYGRGLDEVRAANKGKDKRFAPMQRVKDEIDSIISDYGTTTKTTTDDKLVTELQKIRASLDSVKGGYFSLDDFIKSQKSWSKKSAGKGTLLESLDADTNKVISSRISKAFEDTLDGVIQNPPNLVNKQAAEKLVELKKSYRESKQQMEDYAALPANKLFNVDNVYSLDGESIVKSLSDMTPEKRGIAVKYLEAISPDIVSNIRKQKITDLVNNGIVTGGGTAVSQFNPKAFLKGIEEAQKTDNTLFDFLFKDAAEKADFEKRVAAAKKMANTDSVTQVAKTNPAVNAASDLGSLAGGYQARTAVRGIFGAIGDTASSALINDKDLFKLLFKNEDIRKGVDTAVNKGLVKSAISENTKDASRYSAEQEKQAIENQLYSPDGQQPAEDFSFEAFMKAQEAPAQPDAAVPMQNTQQAPVDPSMQPEENYSFEAFLKSQQGMNK